MFGRIALAVLTAGWSEVGYGIKTGVQNRAEIKARKTNVKKFKTLPTVDQTALLCAKEELDKDEETEKKG